MVDEIILVFIGWAASILIYWVFLRNIVLREKEMPDGTKDVFYFNISTMWWIIDFVLGVMFPTLICIQLALLVFGSIFVRYRNSKQLIIHNT